MGSVESITVKDFKAFKDFQLNLEGRHLLIYGANGSGKSSLYWALYTFLESAGKSTDEVQKYFDPANSQSLVNIHVPEPDNGTAFIRLMLNHSDPVESYEISATEHQTQNNSAIAKGNLASDFITYRFFFKFSDLRNSQTFDFWELFEQEILPFCITTSGTDLNGEWKAISSDLPHDRGLRGGAVAKAYDEFEKRLDEWNSSLLAVIKTIATKAKDFYAEYFGDEAIPIELEIGITDPVRYERPAKALVSPELQLHVKLAGKVITRPHVFLNEAKLTQIAISIRFAASLVNLHESPVKLLVLDDLLVSLDLSNRMKVVEILLSETFDNYQKIILTHDMGFFREFRRMIGVDVENWCLRSLTGNARDGIKAKESKSPIEKAQDYITGHDLEEAALQLRKSAEETAKRYRHFAMKNTPCPGEFHSLTGDLKAARNHLLEQLPLTLYRQAIAGIPEIHRDKIMCTTDDDIDADTSLDPASRGKIKCQRRRLRQFLTQTSWQHAQTIETLDAVIRMKDRVLNPAAHWGEAPLYEAELQKALTLIDRLEGCLK
ncbi:MAG: ATP-binding protein [Thiomicrorhabdus sp.]|jgi:energy-coupling factor transporter ATP-binding protein EcfA2|nr:ATP-binding protein [Thiomicrorhabdus sp.]